jgi:hypothetical protein
MGEKYLFIYPFEKEKPEGWVEGSLFKGEDLS